MKNTPLIIALTLNLSTWVSADTLMLNFRASSGPTGTNLTNSPLHTAVPSFTDTVWNNVNNSDASVGSLDWSDGNEASGVAFVLGTVTDSSVSQLVDLTGSVSSVSNLGNQTSAGIYSGDSIGKGGIFNGTSTQPEKGLGIQFTGLAAGTYNVYLSGRNTNSTNPSFPLTNSFHIGSGTAGSNFDYSAYESRTISYAGTDNATTAWVAASDDATKDNYAKFTITLAEGAALNIAADGSARGFLNSIQLVAVPEPSAFALLLGAAAILLLPTRRKRA